MTLEHKILAQSNIDSFFEETINESVGFVATHIDSSYPQIFSTDGITWTDVTTPTSDVQHHDVTYGDGKFVAVGLYSYPPNAQIEYSTDGITWTIATTISSRYQNVAYGDGKFVAVGYDASSNNSVAYSTDGITWTNPSVPNLSVNPYYNSIVYGDGKFVATVNYITVYSTDGITWTETTMPTGYWNKIIYGDGKFVTVAFAYPQGSITAHSTDAITWTTYTMPTTNSWGAVAYGDGKFAAISTSETAYSTDAISWTVNTVTLTLAPTVYTDMVYGDGKFVAVAHVYGSPSTASYSTDGITWTETTIAASNGYNRRFSHITYGGSVTYISTNESKTVYTVPSNTEAIVSSIFISNTSASSETYDLAVVPNGETLSDVHYIRKSVELLANDFHTVETKLTLSAGDQIVAKSLYNNIQINIFGVEKS